jgi:hypothetical protein
VLAIEIVLTAGSQLWGAAPADQAFTVDVKLPVDSTDPNVGAFTVDNFPVFDHMRPNVFVAADSNHGYKMIGVGREVAQVMTGGHSGVLYPFRYERFATGDLHPVSNSPYPWS